MCFALQPARFMFTCTPWCTRLSVSAVPPPFPRQLIEVDLWLPTVSVCSYVALSLLRLPVHLQLQARSITTRILSLLTRAYRFNSEMSPSPAESQYLAHLIEIRQPLHPIFIYAPDTV